MRCEEADVEIFFKSMLEEKRAFEGTRLLQPALIRKVDVTPGYVWEKETALDCTCASPRDWLAAQEHPSKKILQHLDLSVRIISDAMDVEKWENLPVEQGLLSLFQQVWVKVGQGREQAPLHYKD